MSDYGTFGWYELMTTNPAAARDFYTKVIGWSLQGWGDKGDYVMWVAADGVPMGASMELPQQARDMGAPPHWTGYVYVPDLAATLAKVTARGGKVVVPPTPVPTVGQIAAFFDPQGASICVLQPDQLNPGASPQGPGHMGWHELATTDVEAAKAFYFDVFGWNETMAMDMGGGMMYHLFGKGESAFGGLFVKPPQMPGPSTWMYYVRVPSVAEAIAQTNALGGQVLMGPHEVPGGDVIAQGLDPQGAFFAVVGGA